VFFLELIVALIVAILVIPIIVPAVLRVSQRTHLVWPFLIIFLGSWAGGIWVKPFGPSFQGVYWLSFFLAGLIIALILAVSAQRRIPRNRRESLEMLLRIEKQKKLNQLTYITLKLFFWALLLLLTIVIITRYASN